MKINTPEERKKQITIARRKSAFYGRKLQALISGCKHEMIIQTCAPGFEQVCATCDVCGRSMGWWCEKSPSCYCVPSDKGRNQTCIHCGEPTSRTSVGKILYPED